MVSAADRQLIVRELRRLEARWGSGWSRLGVELRGDLVKAAVFDVLAARLDEEALVEARDLVRATVELISTGAL